MHKGALRGGKIVLCFPPLGSPWEPRGVGRAPRPNVCSLCNSAKDRDVRHTKGCGLSHRCCHHPALRAPLLLGASPEKRRKDCHRKILLARSADLCLQRGWLAQCQEAGPGGLRRASVSLRSDLIKSGLRGFESRQASWILSIKSWVGGSSSSFMTITIQLTVSLSLWTPRRAHSPSDSPTGPSHSGHKLNYEAAECFPNGHPSSGGRESMGEPPAAARFGPGLRGISTQLQHCCLAQAKEHPADDYLQLQGSQESSQQRLHLLEPVITVSSAQGGLPVPWCHSSLADRFHKAKGMERTWEALCPRGQNHCRRQETWQRVGRARLWADWVHTLVPSLITWAASRTWYLLCVCVSNYINDHHAACACRLTVNSRVYTWKMLGTDYIWLCYTAVRNLESERPLSLNLKIIPGRVIEGLSFFICKMGCSSLSHMAVARVKCDTAVTMQCKRPDLPLESSPSLRLKRPGNCPEAQCTGPGLLRLQSTAILSLAQTQVYSCSSDALAYSASCPGTPEFRLQGRNHTSMTMNCNTREIYLPLRADHTSQFIFNSH